MGGAHIAAISVVVTLVVLIVEVRANTEAVHGDLAHAWAACEARFGDPGEVTEWSGIDAFTVLRHDEGWKIVSLAYVADGR